MYTVTLSDGEHIQKLDLCSGWFIEKIKMTTNLNQVFGPWGVEGSEERKPHRHIRKGVNPKHVYLDGVRGYVVRTQGAKAINRVAFKWSFVMDKKISKYSYHHSVVLRPESERISVCDLERDINLSDAESETGGGRRDWPPGRIFRDPIELSIGWSDEDDMVVPPTPPPNPVPVPPPHHGPWMPLHHLHHLNPEIEGAHGGAGGGHGHHHHMINPEIDGAHGAAAGGQVQGMEEDSQESDREDEEPAGAGDHPHPDQEMMNNMMMPPW